MKRSHIKYIILLLSMIAAMAFVFCRNISYEYIMLDEPASILSHFSGEISNYEVTEESDGYYFTMTDTDPRFILAGITPPRGVELCFDRTKMGPEELPVQVFYTRFGEDYSERRSSKTILETDQSSCILPVPSAEYDMLRIDIDGNFYLTDIKACYKLLERPYISDQTTKACLLYFPVIILGFSLVFWAHSTNQKELGMTGKKYIKAILTGKENASREVYLDYMRIFATVCVILGHTCNPMAGLPIGDWRKLLMSFLFTFAVNCNLLYVMLSGSLLLSSKKETGIGAFYLRRASKILLPLVLYYILYLRQNKVISLLPPENIGEGFRTILQGSSESAPHFAVIYIIAGLYISAPFLKVMVQHLKDGDLKVMAAAIFLFVAVRTYLPLLGIHPGLTTFLADWEGIFMLGYILTRLQDKLKDKRWFCPYMAIALLLYMGMSVFVYYRSDFMDNVYNKVPTMIITSTAIYILFLKCREWFADKGNFAISLLSKYSYSIILIHWSVLPLVSGKLHMNALRYGCIGGIAVTVILVLLISALYAIVFDNTVVIIFITLLDKITKKRPAASQSPLL